MAGQSALDLSSPLNRLNALPTAVNWRNEAWSPTELYYRNDIVISELTGGAYINISPSATLRGGGEPSTNPTEWYVFGEGAAGVQEIQGTQYITVGPTSTPQITNNGVCEIAIGQNLNNLGTQNDPILEDLGITSVLFNPGISVTGNTVTNTGVIHVNGGAGITVTGSSDLTISHTGVVSLTQAPTPGLTVGAGATPLITNTGLLSVIASTGLVNDGTPQAPELRNDGVIDISGSSSILVTDFPTIKLSTVNPSISLVGILDSNVVMTPPTTNYPTPSRIPVTQIAGSVWATSIATQQPYSTGTFTLFITLGTNIFTTSSSGASAFGPTTITIYDSVNNKVYPATQGFTDYNLLASSSRLFSSQIRVIRPALTRIVIDLAKLWATGFRQMTHIQISQRGGTLGSANLTLTSHNINILAAYNSGVLL